MFCVGYERVLHRVYVFVRISVSLACVRPEESAQNRLKEKDENVRRLCVVCIYYRSECVDISSLVSSGARACVHLAPIGSKKRER